MAVVAERLVTFEQRQNGEAVVCYDDETGAELWTHQMTGLFDDLQGGPGPRSTPQIDEDKVYAFGATGDLVCLTLVDGQVVWKRDVLKDTGVQNAHWGMTSSPLADGGRLIVNIGSPNGNGLLSFDKRTGEEWTPIRIETPAGKREYAAAQRAFADRAAPLRQRLIEECERLLSRA